MEPMGTEGLRVFGCGASLLALGRCFGESHIASV